MTGRVWYRHIEQVYRGGYRLRRSCTTVGEMTFEAGRSGSLSTTWALGSCSGARDGATEKERIARIIQYWRSVELLSVPDVKPSCPKEDRWTLSERSTLPWEKKRYASNSSDRWVWQYNVYGGVFSLDTLHKQFVQLLGASDPDFEERAPRGSSALFAAVVTHEGRLQIDSVVLSTAAWALGRAVRPGPHSPRWLVGFAEAQERFKVALRDRLEVEDDDAALSSVPGDMALMDVPLTYPILCELVALGAEQLGVGLQLKPKDIRVICTKVDRQRPNDFQLGFLNSLFLRDLERVSDSKEQLGTALASYLQGEEAVLEARRIDIRSPDERREVLEALAPERVPEGRWPAQADHSLATGQQLAVNTIVDQLGQKDGLYAVNGPPGTGKTTMLRDVIAAVIVNRAKAMSNLAHPLDGFDTPQVVWRTSSHTRKIAALRPELTGYEMVIASSNNGAVANVTREIPLQRAIDDAWRDKARYFSLEATRMLGEDAWGLVAAQLGRKVNCSEFRSCFWFGRSPASLVGGGEESKFGRMKRASSGESEPTEGFEAWLKAVRTRREEAPDWSSAVASFESALRTEGQIRRVRKRYHEALLRHWDHESTEHARKQELLGAEKDDEACRVALEKATARYEVARSAVTKFSRQRQVHFIRKPRLWESLLTLGLAIRRWHREDEWLARKLAGARADEEAAQAICARDRAELRLAGEQRRAADERYQAVCRDRRASELCLEEAVHELGDHVPDHTWWSDRRRRELCAPWLDSRWNMARVHVFLAALHLHHAFIAGAASVMYGNLQAAVEVVDRVMPPEAKAKDLAKAWQSLFLVVPVVSTTFASVERLFEKIGPETFGWLLIDEAGQAMPQAAVGAIWRSRRVVAVGDPLQLEPVSGTLYSSQAALAQRHQVEDTWWPGRTSVQALADRASRLGTWLAGPEDAPIWVGAPLTVHRRCQEPMFGIVNDLVYGGLMVHGTSTSDPWVGLADSSWVHVTAAHCNGHWIPAEGRAVLEILEYLERQGVAPNDIMVVAPFRAVSEELERLMIRRYGRSKGYGELKIPSYGTVHTAQGKEAEVVIFVLGGDLARPQARSWVTQKPNLFNVAMSRAKRRIYIVGDRNLWKTTPYFDRLEGYLVTRPLKSQHTG